MAKQVWKTISFQETVKGSHQATSLQALYGMVSNERIQQYTERLNKKYQHELIHGFNGHKNLYQNDKANNFPVAMFSLNNVDRHSNQKITPEQHTGIINLDLDENSKNELLIFKSRLPEIPYLQFCAESVSGATTGHLWANILVEIPTRFEELPPILQERFPKEIWLDCLHKAYISFVTESFQYHFGITVGSVKDLKRARYIGYDPHPYYNKKAELIPLQMLEVFITNQPPEEQPQNKIQAKTTASPHIKKAAFAVLRYHRKGLFDDREKFVNFMMSCKNEGMQYDDIDDIVKYSKGYNRKENEKIFEGLKPNGTIAFGTVVRLAKQLNPTLWQEQKTFQKSQETQEEDTTGKLGSATKMGKMLNQLYHFSYNTLTEKVHVNKQPISDTLYADIYCNMVDYGFKNASMMEQVWIRESVKNSYHPVKQYFESLEYNGKPQLVESVLNPIFRDKDDLFYYLFRKWIIGCVAKSYSGCQNPMLVLAGGQGLGKSVFTRWLCPIPGMYLDGAIHADDNDDNLRLTDRLIWEVSELGATTRRQDVEALKAFLTREMVTVRRPYGRYDLNKQALASFIGTINDDGIGFLNDTTGNRRFRVCHLTSIDWNYVEKLDVSQLWAEAHYAWKTGETQDMDKYSNSVMQTRIKESFEYTDPIEDFFFQSFALTDDENDIIPTTEVLKEVKLAGYRGTSTRSESMALAKVMKKIGVGKYRKANTRFYTGIRMKEVYQKAY